MTTSPRLTVDELLALGAVQQSRKYRRVACLPPGLTALEALRAHRPELWGRALEHAEDLAKSWYLQEVAERLGYSLELTQEEFNEFLTKTGRKGHVHREPCEHCSSTGGWHGKTCPARNKEMQP